MSLKTEVLVTELFFTVVDNYQSFRGGGHRTYFHPPVFLQTDITALQTQRGLAIFDKKKLGAINPHLYSAFSGKVFEALFEQDNDIVKKPDMAHSISLINLYQSTMRKKF